MKQYMPELSLNTHELKILFDVLLPLGKVPRYDKNSQTIQLTDTTTRRFIFDSNYIRRLGKSIELSRHSKFDPAYLGFGFFETLGVLIQEDYELYRKLFDFFDNIDRELSTITDTCSQCILLFSHSSFGDRLFPHIHQDNVSKKPTMSYFARLTHTDSVNPTLILNDTLSEDSKIFSNGYTNHALLLSHARKSSNTEIVPINSNDIVVFDGFKIPHSLTYTDDLWVTIVYDHVSPNLSNFNDKGRYHVCTLK